jgi:hypothetical protein
MDVFFSTVLVKLVSTANSRNDSKWIKQQRQFLHKKISKAGFFRDSVKAVLTVSLLFIKNILAICFPHNHRMNHHNSRYFLFF